MPDLTPAVIAAVLSELYRGATGVPRRFYLSSLANQDHELRRFASRTRALRPEFFNQVGEQLECVCDILMSYPRRPKEGVLGFATWEMFKNWRAASDEMLEQVQDVPLEADWAQSVRKRLQRVYEINHGDEQHRRPVVLSLQQLCTLAEKQNFDGTWWSDILNYPTSRPENRLVFFSSQIGPEKFAITREDFIIKWYHPSAGDLAAAQKRYDFEEIDEDAAFPNSG